MGGRLLAQLVQAAVPVVTVLALVMALRPRPRRSDVESSLARAQWLTVAVGAVAVYLAAVTVLRAVEQNPLGIIVFLTLCVHAVGGGMVLRGAWRRHRAAVQDEKFSVATADAAAAPRAPHRGLSGEDPPPVRW